MFVVGHIWRWRTGQFGWTTRTTQVLENRWLRLGSPLFHLGAFVAIWFEAVGCPNTPYHLIAVGAGTIAGVMVVVGLGLLIGRRAVNDRVRRTTAQTVHWVQTQAGLDRLTADRT